MTGTGDNPGDHESPPSSYAVTYHTPVLCNTVVETLITNPRGVYVDATLGGGGHSAALIDSLSPDAVVIGVDQDNDALEFAVDRLARFVTTGQFKPIKGNFASLEDLLADESLSQVDGVLLDLGVSSHQLDTASRGFSYMQDGSLDMRMDSNAGSRAAELVNDSSLDELVRILRSYGEEPAAKRIARNIVSSRPLNTTAELAKVVRKTVSKDKHIKTLSRVFQALRIAVNDELDVLQKALEASTKVVRPGGRLVVITYHSLEDRMVKRYLRYGNFEGKPDRDFYGNLLAPWTPVFSKPVSASDEEVTQNPRSRSAHLRAGTKNDHTRSNQSHV